MNVKIEKPTEQQLQELGVKSWPIWEKEVSVFPWHYDSDEIFYLLEGKVKLEIQGGETVEFGKGDLVTLKTGVDCVWTVTEKVRKHYKMI